MGSTSRCTAALAVVLTLWPLGAFAATTGNLFGVVTDETGAALPGVTVTLTSPVLQGYRTVVTGESGEYNIAVLPPGVYRAEFSISGLMPVSRENIRISIDTTTRHDASLAMGVVSEAITVTADAVVVDPTTTTVQQNFGTNHLKYAAIGTAGRSYQSILSQAPGVVGTGNAQVMGANLGQNNYLLDGVNTTDPVTHQFGSNLPFDAIQEISIQTLGKDAEYGRAIGGVVNVVTKSGGNEYSATVDVRYNSNDLSESGTHFDAGDSPSDEVRPSATLGGPIVRDQVWFFVSGQQPDTTRINTPLTTADFMPGPRTFKGTDLLGKVTVTPAANHTLSLRYTTNEATIEHAQNSAFYRPEADTRQTQESTIYNLGYDAILTPKWLAQVQVGIRNGFLRSGPMSEDLATPGVIDLATSIRSVNGTNVQYGDRDRRELIASTTYFLDRVAGGHTLKAGLNYDQSEFLSFNNATGTPPAGLCSPQFGQPAGAQCGFILYFDNGAPIYAEASTIVPEETYHSDLTAFYVQDEWHPITPVTLRLGLRYEDVKFEVPRFSDTPNLSKLQPRIGAAWDVLNNANTVLHGFWGEVMDDNGLTLASFGSRLGTVTSGFKWDGTNFLPDGWVGGPSGNAYDPNLRPTYSTEANIGLTQRIWTNTSFDLTGVWRESSDIFEDTCESHARGGCDFFLMTNTPAGQDVLRSEYRGVIAEVETRPYSWLSGLVSYTWSESRGSVEYTQNSGSDFNVDPAHFVNRFGYMSDDARHRVKASGFVRVPWGTTIGFDFLYNTGTPYNTTASNPPTEAVAGINYGTLFVKPRGDDRLPDFHRLDLQFEQDFHLGRIRLGVIGSVLNVFNTEIASAVGTSIGTYNFCRTSGDTIDARCIANPIRGLPNGENSDNPPNGTWDQLRITSATYGNATSWQRPRRYELGIRVEF